jgi:hypothetical protein
MVRKKYKGVLGEIHLELNRHIHTYRDASKKCKLREHAARDDVKRWLAEHGVTEAPILRGRDWNDVATSLREHLRLSGLTTLASEVTFDPAK